MRTKTGNDDEDGVNQAAGSDPGDEPAPPQQSAEPWRQAAVAWTQHAEAWAAQAEAAARAAIPPAEGPQPGPQPPDSSLRDAPLPDTPLPVAPVGRADLRPVAHGDEQEIWGRPEGRAPAITDGVPAEPPGWASPTGAGDMLPVHAQLAAAEPTPLHTVRPEPPDVDDLGEIPELPPVSPWPDLSPDERSAHTHVWQPTARRGRTWAPLAGAAAFVLCLATASVAVWSWTRPEPTPLAAPAPPLVAVPATPSAEPPPLNPTSLPEEGAASAPIAPAGSTPIDPAATGGRPEQTAPRPADALATWADALRQLDIPPTALQAYGYAEAVLAKAKPSCRLSWTLLAGIGAVESNHGRYGGASLQPDGTSSRPIIGVPLAGIGVERVTDTDHGLLDGDLTYDRAIGPMQFLPSTWKAWAVDADNNGRADPYDIDDASLAAAYYLCGGGQNLASGSGWSSAVFSYNRVPAYVERVYEYADAYGRAS